MTDVINVTDIHLTTLGVVYALGAMFTLVTFALPRMNVAYADLVHARERAAIEPEEPFTAADIDWVRYRARRFLRSLVGGTLLVVLWPLALVCWLIAELAWLIWEAI